MKLMLIFALSFLPMQASAELETFTITKSHQPIERIYQGTVEAIKQATVSAQTSGQVASVYFDVGDPVPSDTPIIKLVDREQQAAVDHAQSAVLAAEAELKRAKAEYARIQVLFKQGVSPEQALDTARKTFQVARSNLKQASANLKIAKENLSYTLIRAPYAGVVTKRHVEVGELVRPGTPLMSGFSLDALRVTVNVAQSDIEKIKIHQHAVLIDPNGKRWISPKITVFPYADPASHTFIIRVAVPKQLNNLTPGMAIPVAFTLGSEKRMMIPTTAIAKRSEISGVYIKKPEGQIHFRLIRTGIVRNKSTEVLSGLSVGEVIFVYHEAATRLRAKVPE